MATNIQDKRGWQLKKKSPVWEESGTIRTLCVNIKVMRDCLFFLFHITFLTMKSCVSPIFIPYSESPDCIMYVRAHIICSSTVGSTDLCAEQSWPGNLPQLIKYNKGTICQQNIDISVDRSWPKDQHQHFLIWCKWLNNVWVTRRNVFKQFQVERQTALSWFGFGSWRHTAGDS